MKKESAAVVRPFVHLNLAVRVDGCVAGTDGQPLTISCEADWRRVHLLRESYDAVAVGGRTWSRDQPRLTVRREVIGRDPSRQPARVIFAGSAPCDLGAAGSGRTFVIGGAQRLGAHPSALFLPAAGRELAGVLAALHGHGIRSLLVEGGPTLLRSFLEQGEFDRLTVYVPTADGAAARAAALRVLAGVPELGSRPFGCGKLLDSGDLAPADRRAASRGPDPGTAALLRDRLAYLDPDACGVANGGCRGDRLALVGPVPLPIDLDGLGHRFAWYAFARVPAGEESPPELLANSVLVYGDARRCEAPLVRLHSGCHTGDVLRSLRCDCGPQLEQALREIVTAGCGIAVYLTEHEGRGIGLWAKAMAYLLQDAGCDTYEANRRLGFPEDARRFTDAAVVLASLLPRRRITLLSNNPDKREALAACGFDVVEVRALAAGHNEINRRYLAAKARMGHTLPERDPDPQRDGEEPAIHPTHAEPAVVR